MKKSISLAIVTFFISLGLGVLIQQSWISALIRALISAGLTFLACRVIFAIVQHFLPELLVQPESGFEGFTSERPIGDDVSPNLDLDGEDSEVATLSAGSLGQKVDVTLDDQDAAHLEISPMSFAPLSSESSQSSYPQSNLEKQKQPFMKEDPAMLAKMVRTRLSDDD